MSVKWIYSRQYKIFWGTEIDKSGWPQILKGYIFAADIINKDEVV